MNIHVGILAIGNEVVEGQITNRNASWISQRIQELGAEPRFHLSCLDIKEDIHRSLNFMAQHCHLIIVSGGLGPTKDDRTRQSLATWCGTELEHNDDAWATVQSKLKARQVTIRDGHKNQALIPRGAELLQNEKGVAPGFFMKADNCFLASLPGPPNELHWMFENQLNPIIEERIGPKPQQQLRTWICLGAPESDIAHISESILGENFEIGYRLHKPYVEVKVWAPLNINQNDQLRFDTLTEKLSPYYVGPSIKQIRKNFHDKISSYRKVYVIDHLSSGLLLEKLKEDFQSKHIRYQCFEHDSFRFFNEDEISAILKKMEPEADDLMISLFPKGDTEALISFNDRIENITLPRSIPVRSKLGQLYTIENCFLKV